MNTQTNADMQAWLLAATRSSGQNVLHMQRDMFGSCLAMVRLSTAAWADVVGAGMRTLGDMPQSSAIGSAPAKTPAISARPAKKSVVNIANPVKTVAKPVKFEAKPVEPKVEAAPDDLKMISGIGPSTEKKLHDRGIFRFAQIARLSDDEIDGLNAELGFRGRIQRDDWLGQSTILAAGDSTDFSRRFTADHS